MKGVLSKVIRLVFAVLLIINTIPRNLYAEEPETVPVQESVDVPVEESVETPAEEVVVETVSEAEPNAPPQVEEAPAQPIETKQVEEEAPVQEKTETVTETVEETEVETVTEPVEVKQIEEEKTESPAEEEIVFEIFFETDDNGYILLDKKDANKEDKVKQEIKSADEIISVIAEAKEGYEFVEWQLNGIPFSTNLKLDAKEIKFNNQDRYKAIFKEIEKQTEVEETIEPEIKEENEEEKAIQIFFEVEGNGLIALNAEGFEATDQIIQEVTKSDELLSVVAQETDGFEFVAWKFNDEIISEEKELKAEMIDFNDQNKYVAEFKEIETEEKPIEELMPAQEFTGYAGKVFVYASVDVGVLPAGTTMSVTEVPQESIYDAVNDAVEGKVTNIYAVDITFWAKDEEIQPAGPVNVVMRTVGSEEGSGQNVVHIDYDDKVEVVDANITSNTAVTKTEFTAEQFSIYAVVTTGNEARWTIKFMSGSKKVAEVYVKETDTLAELGEIMADPGAGELTGNKVFEGWYISNSETADYTAESPTKNIEQVRQYFFDQTINDEQTYYVHAMIFTAYNVSYKAYGNTVERSTALAVGDNPAIYTIDAQFVPDDPESEFQGWYVGPIENATLEDGTPIKEDVAYVNGTRIKVTGDLTMNVKAPTGKWLIFKENGKGASYTSPQFIETLDESSVTKKPSDPVRFGYTFGGWYTDEACSEGKEFTFGGKIEKTTYLYAKWIEINPATYSVVIWKENVDGNGYDFADSVSLEANVNTIATTTVRVSGSGAAAYITVGGKNYNEYKGFHYTKMEANNEDKVVPNGTTVVNVYYDRTQYTLKFYYARSRNGRYWISSNYDATNPGTWNGQGNREPGCTFGTKGTEVRGDYTYYYSTLTAKYGTYIGDKWPTYEEFDTYNGYRLGSWAIMHSAQAYIDSGQGTIKGKITIMDEQILGDLTSENGNYLYANYDTASSQYDWTYNIFFEKEGGGYNTRPDEVVYARSHDPGTYWETQQHAPSYPGMEEKRKEKLDRQLVINFYYAPKKYSIAFMDGVYVNGDGVVLDNQSDRVLKTVADITYKTDISSYNKDGSNYYVPQAGDIPGFNPEGYVFDGWYADKTCKTPFRFNKMPVDGVTVYARWVQVQYRVFLNPNVPTSDTTFSMGDQETSFRVSYGGKINSITAVREGYELIGWYYDEACKKSFNFDAYVFQGNNVPGLKDYDKTRPTETDKWGRPTESTNKDVDRFWITQSIDLYAKWRFKLVGAEGINVEYDANGGSNPPTDTHLYKDATNAIAGAASSSPVADKHFLYWVVQKWDATSNKYVDTGKNVYPGDTFEVLKENAKVIENEGHSEEKPSLTYIVQLRAEYGDKDTATPTHITWYANNKTTAYKNDDKLQINEAINIEPANLFSYEGYKFVGWARYEEGSKPNSPTDDSKIWLVYHEAEGETKAYFTATQTAIGETTVTQVACDEKTPYHDLYAVWKPIEYSIRFNKNAEDATGEMSNQVFKYDEEKALSTNKFTRDHYVFAGWSKSSTATEPEYGDEAAVKNLTLEDKAIIDLYAVWKNNKYEVTFVDDDGTVLKAATKYDYGTKAADIVKPADPTKPATAEYTYTFAGWAPEIADVKENATYKATYEKTVRTYTVTWKNEDGIVLETDKDVAYGTTPKYDGATPTKAADAQYTYTFDKWTPDVVAVTGDATYTASFTGHSITPPTPGPEPTPDPEPDPPTPPTPPGPPTPGPEPTPEPAPEPTPEPTPTPSPEPEPIPDEPVPQTDPEKYWALANLLASIGTVLTALGMILTFFRKKKDEEEEENAEAKEAAVTRTATSEEEAKEEEEDDENKRKKSKFLGLIPAIGSVILFILTEDMRNKMIWTDKYTLAMVIILLVNFVLAYLTRNKKKDDDEEEDKPADPNQTVTA